MKTATSFCLKKRAERDTQSAVSRVNWIMYSSRAIFVKMKLRRAFCFVLFFRKKRGNLRGFMV